MYFPNKSLLYGLTALSLALLVFAAPMQPAAAQEATPEITADVPQVVVGTVWGTIQNGTPGGSVPPGMAVKLYIVDSELNTETRDTLSTLDGTFSFEDVPIRADRGYQATVFYNSGIFVSPLSLGDPINPILELPVAIYETTDDLSVVTVSQLIVQVVLLPEGLQVMQIVIFENTSDRVFWQGGDIHGSVQIVLPEDAAEVQFNDPERYTLGEDGRTVTDLQPVFPQVRHNVHAGYILPFDGSSTVIELPQLYTLSGTIQVITSEDIRITGDNVIDMGMRTLGSGVFPTYSVTIPQPSGAPVWFEVQRSETTGAASDGGVSRGTLIALLLMAGGVVVLLAAGWLYLRERRTKPENLKAQMDALVAQIGELDKMHQDGQILEDMYTQQRQQLKDRLAQLLKQQNK